MTNKTNREGFEENVDLVDVIAVHSIHYLDLIRAMLGNPVGIHARTLGHPGNELAQTRTSAILDFGGDVRCTLSINHDQEREVGWLSVQVAPERVAGLADAMTAAGWTVRDFESPS